MYQDLKKQYWWKQMKADVVEYVAKCQVCQVVKAEHKKPAGVLQPLFIPEWKWESISMDFISGLPLSQGKDWIWVIVDRLTKSAHFIAVKGTTTASQYAEIFMKEVVKYHGVPKSIISDRGSVWTSQFWKAFTKD